MGEGLPVAAGVFKEKEEKKGWYLVEWWMETIEILYQGNNKRRYFYIVRGFLYKSVSCNHRFYVTNIIKRVKAACALRFSIGLYK
ncbi:hypothetical protein QVD17_18249 [Tagetes erecta]|uniref:Uncharacterized protein n=1 Tax=Tagetes erecta TaxID=13708 RepID=A0AAD8NVM6_TARER|nr:hypothetical protein QVD17_18249 [Tagetes erecta]